MRVKLPEEVYRASNMVLSPPKPKLCGSSDHGDKTSIEGPRFRLESRRPGRSKSSRRKSCQKERRVP